VTTKDIPVESVIAGVLEQAVRVSGELRQVADRRSPIAYRGQMTTASVVRYRTQDLTRHRYAANNSDASTTCRQKPDEGEALSPVRQERVLRVKNYFCGYSSARLAVGCAMWERAYFGDARPTAKRSRATPPLPEPSFEKAEERVGQHASSMTTKHKRRP